MDTKTLYDWAATAGLNFTDPQGYIKAAEVWWGKVLSDKDVLNEKWVEWMVAGMTDPEHIQNVADRMARYHDGANSMRNMSWGSDGTVRAYADSLHSQSSVVGADIMYVVHKQAKEWVNMWRKTWWTDVCNYHMDMEKADADTTQ